MGLSADDRERLAKLLAMFSSAFDGEILNAAKAAERLIKARGETWQTVIITGNRDIPRHEPPQPRHKAHRSEFQDDIEACIKRASLLTPWEQEFLTSISDRPSLSEKQRAILKRIKTKIAAYSDMTW